MERSLFREALLHCKSAFRHAFFFSLAINVLGLVGSIYSLQVLDRVLTSSSMETLIMLSIIVFVTYIFFGFLQVVRSLVFTQIGDWLDRKLTPVLVQKSIERSAIQRLQIGSQMTRDFGAIKAFLTGPGLIAMFDLPWTLVYILVIAFIHPILAVVTVAAAGILLFLAYLNDAKTKELLNKANELNVRSSQQVESATRNAEVVESMGMMGTVITRWQKVNQQVLELQTKAGRNGSVISTSTRIFRMTVQMLMYAFGAYFVIQQQMTAGGIIATSILSGKALGPFDTAISTWKGLISARKSYERINQFLEKAPDRQAAMSLPEPTGRVQLENVSFAPEGSKKPILKALNVSLEAGDCVGVIGPSGSGKTTLAKLILGIWKSSSGAVRLDHADVYQWNRDEFGKHVGYLPQDIELFDGTVKENIARMDAEADPNAIVEAAKKANAHELILSLPQGYDTPVGVGGSTLSAGQRQRVGLARSFFGDPKLLILDEPNANLDQVGDAALARSILALKEEKRTILIISHRSNIVAVVDKLLVIKDGQVALFGPKEEVLNKLGMRPGEALGGQA